MLYFFSAPLCGGVRDIGSVSQPSFQRVYVFINDKRKLDAVKCSLSVLYVLCF